MKTEMINNISAFRAPSKDYNLKGLAYSGQLYTKTKSTEDGKINLFFDYCPNGLISFGLALTGFEIAEEDKVFYPATAKINKHIMVTVFSEKAVKPVAVHYCFIPCTKATLLT